jgi:glycerol kinase
MAKATYGTGSSVMVNAGEKPVFCGNLASSIAWGIGGNIHYVLEGNVNYSGAVIKWLVEDVGLLASPSEAGRLAAEANPLDTSYLVPAFSGLGSPHWVPEAKACLWGMTRKTGRKEIVKAAEESIAYQIVDIVRCMKDEGGVELSELRVDGGCVGDSYLLQFQADMLALPVSASTSEELSGMGAAYAAGMALGLYDRDISLRIPRKIYEPAMDEERRSFLYGGWLNAVRAVIQGASP